jgi:hypothetical protein
MPRRLSRILNSAFHGWCQLLQGADSRDIAISRSHHNKKAKKRKQWQSSNTPQISEGSCGNDCDDRSTSVLDSPFCTRTDITSAPGTLKLDDNGLMLPTTPLQALIECSSAKTEDKQVLHCGKHPWRHSGHVQPNLSACKRAVPDFTLVQVCVLVLSVNDRSVDVHVVERSLTSTQEYNTRSVEIGIFVRYMYNVRNLHAFVFHSGSENDSRIIQRGSCGACLDRARSTSSCGRFLYNNAFRCESVNGV